MKKILITGSSGMVGKNIVNFDNASNYILLTPTSSELNLLNQDNVKTYLLNNKPDYIIHCAGVVGGIQANINNPVRFLVENTLIGINLINSAYELGVKNLINLASSCMYPKDKDDLLNEELILKGELEPTNEGYALAKITCTRLCEYITKENPNLNYKTVIPCNLYGKYDKFDPKNSHMLPAVIRKIDTAMKTSQNSVEIWGDGLARREFMYAEDLADFIYFALDNIDIIPQNINVGLGSDLTINQYYEAVAKVIGYSGSFHHDFSKPSGMKRKVVDVSKLSTLGWQAKHSLHEGISKTYNWYKDVYKTDNN